MYTRCRLFIRCMLYYSCRKKNKKMILPQRDVENRTSKESVQTFDPYPACQLLLLIKLQITCTYYLLVFALTTNSWFVMLGSIQFGLGSPKHCKGKPSLNEIAIFPSKYLKTNSLLLQQGLVMLGSFQP